MCAYRVPTYLNLSRLVRLNFSCHFLQRSMHFHPIQIDSARALVHKYASIEVARRS